MFKSQIDLVINILVANNISLKPGMTDAQIQQAQHYKDINFADIATIPF